MRARHRVELPPYGRRLLHLAALWGFAVAEPILSMLEATPEFLVVRGVTRSDVVALGLLVTVAVPLAVVAAEIVIGWLSPTFSNALHLTAVWLVSVLLCLEVGRSVHSGGLVVVLTLAVAGGLTLAYARWRPVRLFLTVGALLPILAVAVFVVTIPIAVDDAPGASVELPSRTPIVLVILDELPVSSLLRSDGSLDASRYPGFGALARESVWYRRATTTHTATSRAVPAILTGRDPRDGSMPTLRDHPQNLFTLLGERYAIRATEQITRLCPARYCPGTATRARLDRRQREILRAASVAYLHRVLPRDLRRNVAPLPDAWRRLEDIAGASTEASLGAAGSPATQTSGRGARFERFIESLTRAVPARSLFVEHSLLPHSPWEYLPSGARYGNASTVEGVDDQWLRWRDSPLLVDQALERHLLQVGYVDTLVGRLVAQLKREGLWRRALVVVTADHGTSFRPGSYRRELDAASAADVAAVPLFVKYPFQADGRVDERVARSTDVLPTIADVVGVSIPWDVDGVSLRESPVSGTITVADTRNGSFVADSETVAARVLATARRNAALFGNGPDVRLRVTGRTEVLGRTTTSFDPEPIVRSAVRIDGADDDNRVRATSDVVPARVAGELSRGSVEVGALLAIAVAGRLRATTRAFEHHGALRFSAMVDEAAFRPGWNRVQVFALIRRGSAISLGRIGPDSQTRRRAHVRTDGHDDRVSTASSSSR